jgi:hypothetical protein
MPRSRSPSAGAVARLRAAALAAFLAAGPAAADIVGNFDFLKVDQTGTLNMYGATGLIDMPTAQVQPDGQLSITYSRFGPIRRSTLSFQLTPRISASFRFLGVHDWNDRFCPPDCNGANAFDPYYDRSFDIRYQILTETALRPALLVGLQDFAGTGILSGEYLVATKTLAPGLKVTAGLGWGRLGTDSELFSVGTRPPIDIGFGGDFNPGTYFRGPVAPFGGIEWQVNDRWGVKLEYSSDAYTEEAGNRQTFDRRSPLNFGLEYSPVPDARFGLYYMYGSQLGLTVNLTLDPKNRPGGGVREGAPLPVLVRAPGASGWTAADVSDTSGQRRAAADLVALLREDAIRVEGLRVTGSTAELRIRNDRIDAGPQAIGRAARAMSRVLPPGIETFRITPMVQGMPAATVTLRRRDLETFEFAVDGSAQMRRRVTLEPAIRLQGDPLRDPDLYPALSWSLAPYNRVRLFDQIEPFKIDLGIRGTVQYDIAPGLVFEASVTQKVVGNLGDRPPLPERKRLHPVRSAAYYYDRVDRPTIETLALHWSRQIAPNVFGRVSVGYLEQMYGGISTEVLWKPVNRRWALGVELNRVAQRSPNQDFSFKLPPEIYETDVNPPGGPDSYTVTSGHVSAYYQLANGFHVQLDVGRYLAGDVGATLSFDREFANGWRVGAFATKTNVSSEDFGSGSFDKGIRLEIPFAWVLGKPTRQTSVTTVRPFGRDGGARLYVARRLYEDVRGYHAPRMDDQWGRFWK